MPNGSAFVDDRHTSCLRLVYEVGRVVSCSLEDFHFAIENRIEVGFIGRWIRRGKYGEIDPKGTLRHLATSPDLLLQGFRGRLSEPSQYAKPARVRHGRSKLCPTDPLHPSLYDRVLDAQQLCDTCLH